MAKRNERETMLIKNKAGRIVRVFKERGVKLITKDNAQIVFEEPKKEGKKDEAKIITK